MSALARLLPAALLALLLVPGSAAAQKAFINFSNQTANSVCAGGVESTYAADNASRLEALLTGYGFQVRTSDDFYGSNAAAASWGATSFLSIHSNAGGGHGTVTLKGWYGDSTAFATDIQTGIMSKLPYRDRGVVSGTCGTGRCRVLNYSGQTAALVEVVFHDCCTTSGYTGHPPSEAAFLVSTSGRQKIAEGLAKGECAYYNKTCTGGTVTPTNGTIIGLIYKNGDTAQRVPGATVKLSTNASATSSDTGVYTFSVPPGSSYSVTVSATGFKTVTKTCNAVVAGGTTWCSVGLEPASTGTDKGFIKGTVCTDLTDSATCNATRVDPAVVSLNTGASVNYNDSSSVWVFEVPAGSSYTVSAEVEGYQTGTRTCGPVTPGATTWCSVKVTAAPAPTTGVLEGIVYTGGDKANRVFPATVTLNDGSTITYNGTDKWSFTLAPATYTVSVQASGFQPRVGVSCPAVTAGGTAECDLELQPLVTEADAGLPEDDAGEPGADAGEQPDAGSTAADASVAPTEAPAVPDSSCGCATGAGALFGLFAVPALFALRPRRRGR